jgi:tetratricopeptide (TPR) repeat protein
LNRNQEALTALEAAAKLNPDQPGLQVQLGSAYLQAGSDEKALAAFQRAIGIDSGSETPDSNSLNSVAYELAEKKKSLPLALEYAEKAVRAEEEQSSKVQIAQLQPLEFTMSTRLAAYWDTLGWVHFQMGNVDAAEKYLKAAWAISQSADIGDHLGQVYEKRGSKRQAVHAYSLAFEALGRNGDAQLRDKLKASLTSLSAVVPATRDVGVGLSEERTIKMPQIHSWGGGYKSAEFVIALTKDSDAIDAKFLSGAEELRTASTALGSLSSSFPFPDDSHARIVRSGILSCSEISKGCVFVLYPAGAIAPSFSISAN